MDAPELWLSRIFGPYFFVMGLWVLFRNDEAHRFWNAVKNTPPLMVFGGAFNLLIGFTILSTYRSWSFEIPILLTIIGYLQVLKGVLTLFVQEKTIAATERLIAFDRKLSILPIIIGLLLCFYAVYAQT